MKVLEVYLQDDDGRRLIILTRPRSWWRLWAWYEWFFLAEFRYVRGFRQLVRVRREGP